MPIDRLATTPPSAYDPHRSPGLVAAGLPRLVEPIQTPVSPDGRYGYVTSQYTNALQVIDVTPPAGGLPKLAGKVLLGADGVGGQGVLPIPIAYEGWVERAVAAHAPFTSALTGCQRRPILYVTHPDQCRPCD